MRNCNKKSSGCHTFTENWIYVIFIETKSVDGIKPVFDFDREKRQPYKCCRHYGLEGSYQRHVLESVDKKYARIKALKIVIAEIEKALKDK